VQGQKENWKALQHTYQPQPFSFSSPYFSVIASSACSLCAAFVFGLKADRTLLMHDTNQSFMAADWTKA